MARHQARFLGRQQKNLLNTLSGRAMQDFRPIFLSKALRSPKTPQTRRARGLPEPEWCLRMSGADILACLETPSAKALGPAL